MENMESMGSMEFTHFDQSGNATMVDVSEKEVTQRLAVAEGRIRMTAGGDAERTARLRKVIMQLKEKVQKMSIAELNDMATKILPIIKTDLSQATTLKLLTNAPSLLKYEFISQRVPIDGTWEYAGPSFVDMDFKKNNEYLYYTIYEGHAPD